MNQHDSRRHLIALFLVAQAAIWLTGCVRYSYNASGNDLLWGGYERDGEYELLMDVFLMRPYHLTVIYPDLDRTLRYRSRCLALALPASFRETALYFTPESVEAYREDPVAASRVVVRTEWEPDLEEICIVDVVGVVEAGTRIRPTKMRRLVDGSLLTGFAYWHTMYAEIVDGPYAGKVACMDDLSTIIPRTSLEPKARLTKPHPRVLRPVDE
ncbi:MAG: hypothetical protein JXR94_18950 [Candidatus Hydrogenedentes bacterium]|nr:hypothetical protein [Candidatus Hydrogenedentota bacterium]